MREIILLKSAFSIIDQMFHKEIRDGENKRSRAFITFFIGEGKNDYKNPEEMNDFIKNLMDPFNNAVANIDNDYDSYYDEYYELYDIEKIDQPNAKEFKITHMFNPKKYFKKDNRSEKYNQ